MPKYRIRNQSINSFPVNNDWAFEANLSAKINRSQTSWYLSKNRDINE